MSNALGLPTSGALVFDPPPSLPPYSVKLTRNTKGYQWEIGVRADSIKEVLEQTHEIDQELRRKYVTE